MSALALPALGWFLAAAGASEYWSRTVDSPTVDAARTYYGVRWLLAAGAVATLAAGGFDAGRLSPTRDEFAVTYVVVVTTHYAMAAVVRRLALQAEPFDPYEAAETTLDRAFFALLLVPRAVLVYALPFVAFPDSPLVAGALAVGTAAILEREHGPRYVAVFAARTAVVFAVVWWVARSPGAGVGTATVAVAGTYALNVALGLYGRYLAGKTPDWDADGERDERVPNE